MIEMRLHGRGGQGAVTAAELVAQAAIASDKFAQGYPNFGPERRGAPVMAFLRLSDQPIYLRERIEKPDAVIVLDHTLVRMVDVTEGLAPGGTVVINATPEKIKTLAELAKIYRVAVVDANRIAMETLGVPITNTAIIGAMVRATDMVPLAALEAPITKRFGRMAAKNLLALQTAFEQTTIREAPAEVVTSELPPQPAWDDYLRGEAIHPWNAVEVGCDVNRAGSCREFLTGNWRTAGRPVMGEDKCVSCGLCWIICPDMAFQPNEAGGYSWDTRYCKGCGICVRTCPKNALAMEEE